MVCLAAEDVLAWNVGDIWLPKRAGSEDDVFGMQLEGPAVAEDCNFPFVLLMIVLWVRQELGAGPDDQILGDGILFEPLSEFVTRREFRPVGRVGLIENCGNTL